MPIQVPKVGLANDVMVGTLYFNYGAYGWSEKYYIGSRSTNETPTAPYDQAAQDLFNLASYRGYLLGNNVKLTWARCSLLTRLRDSVAAIASPLSPRKVGTETTVEAIDDPQTAILFRMEDGAGRYFNRHIRGLRESWVLDTELIDSVWAAGITPASDFVADPTPTLYTPVQAFQNYLLALLAYTVNVKKMTTGPSPYSVSAYNRTQFRKISSRKTGRPFGLSRGRASARM